MRTSVLSPYSIDRARCHLCVDAPCATRPRPGLPNCRATWTTERFYTGLTHDAGDLTGAQLNQSSFKAVATRTIYDSAGRVISTERYKDVLINVNPSRRDFGRVNRHVDFKDETTKYEFVASGPPGKIRLNLLIDK